MEVETRFESADIVRIIEALKNEPGALLPILHGIQDQLGYIPPESVPVIAKELNLTRAEVHGVITFYHDFRSEKPGRQIVKICQAESCQALGSAALTVFVQEKLGIGFRQTTEDGAVTLEPVYCLGNCAASPAIMVNGRLHGRVTRERFVEILGELEQQG